MTTLLLLHVDDARADQLAGQLGGHGSVRPVADVAACGAALAAEDDVVVVIGDDGGAADALGAHATLVAEHPGLPVLLCITEDGPAVAEVLRRPLTEVAAGDPGPRLVRLRAIAAQAEQVQGLQRSVDHVTRQLGRFAVTATHDLKEPLRAVTGFARLLKDRYEEVLDDSGRTYLNFIDDGAQRLTTMVQALVDFGRASQKDLQLEARAVGDLLRQAVAEMDDPPTLEPGAAAEVTVHVDADLFGRLLAELVDNAVKFHPPERPNTVAVSAAVTDGWWTVQVRDDGIGLAESDVPRALDMFGRLHTREAYAGQGIGLAVAGMVAERLGGELSIDSRVGEGTTVSVRLPVAPG